MRCFWIQSLKKLSGQNYHWAIIHFQILDLLNKTTQILFLDQLLNPFLYQYLLCIFTSDKKHLKIIKSTYASYMSLLCAWRKRYFFIIFKILIIFDHANACASMHLLVKIHNKYLNLFFSHSYIFVVLNPFDC